MKRNLYTSALILAALQLTGCGPAPTHEELSEAYAYADTPIPADAELARGRVIMRHRAGDEGFEPLAAVSARPLRALRGGRAAVYTLPEGADVREVVETLRASGRFDWVEPDYLRRVSASVNSTVNTSVNDPMYCQQWGMSAVGAEDAWDYATGAGVIVAVVDTGVSTGGSDGLYDVLPG